MDLTAIYLLAALTGNPIQPTTVDNASLQRLMIENDATQQRNRYNNDQRELEQKLEHLKSQIDQQRQEAELMRIRNNWR